MAKQASSSSGENPPYSHEQIKELVESVSREGIEELEIEDREFRLHIIGRRSPQQVVTTSAAPPPPPAAAPAAPAPSAEAPAPAPASEPKEDAADAHLKKVTSPMVGTFYASPAPDAAAFVKVGDHVDPDTVLCIVEAMKLMNEIKAEMSGTVKRVLVENAQPVEYGQPLFLIDPS